MLHPTQIDSGVINLAKFTCEPQKLGLCVTKKVLTISKILNVRLISIYCKQKFFFLPLFLISRGLLRYVNKEGSPPEHFLNFN